MEAIGRHVGKVCVSGFGVAREFQVFRKFLNDGGKALGIEFGSIDDLSLLLLPEPLDVQELLPIRALVVGEEAWAFDVVGGLAFQGLPFES